MRWSQVSIQTLREDTHPPLVRAGYKRGQEYLFLGQRTLAKIRAVGDLGRVLAECGVTCLRAGDRSRTAGELVVESPSGEDVLVRGPNYAELLGWAVSGAQPPESPDPECGSGPAEFHTPGVKTIAQIAAFTGLPATSQIKSVVTVAGGNPVLVLLRGDHQLSELQTGRRHRNGGRPARDGRGSPRKFRR